MHRFIKACGWAKRVIYTVPCGGCPGFPRRGMAAAPLRGSRWLLALACACVALRDHERAAAGAVPSLDEVVENVRANEAIFGDHEWVYTATYRSVEPLASRSSHVDKRLMQVRQVAQGGLFLFDERQGGTSLDQQVHRLDALRAYDGEATWAIGNEMLVNKYEQRAPTAEMRPPHLMMLRNNFVDVPMSVYLRGGEEFDALNVLYKVDGKKVSTAVDGEVEYEGRRHVQVTVTVRNRGQTAENGQWNSKIVLLLDPSRNWIPSKNTGLVNGMPANLPAEEDVVTEWLSVAPQIWVPKTVKYTRYDFEGLRQGRLVVNNEEILSTESFSLEPRYDKSFFKPKLTPGATVYVVREGKIVDSYVEGGQPAGRAGSRLWWLWIVTALIAGALVMLAARTWRRPRGGRAGGPA